LKDNPDSLSFNKFCTKLTCDSLISELNSIVIVFTNPPLILITIRIRVEDNLLSVTAQVHLSQA